jgi:hypothetical protein
MEAMSADNALPRKKVDSSARGLLKVGLLALLALAYIYILGWLKISHGDRHAVVLGVANLNVGLYLNESEQIIGWTYAGREYLFGFCRCWGGSDLALLYKPPQSGPSVVWQFR